MYSNKFAAKLVNIRQLCKKDMEKLSIFMVLSTYYPTFRVLYITSSTSKSINRCSLSFLYALIILPFH